MVGLRSRPAEVHHASTTAVPTSASRASSMLELRVWAPLRTSAGAGAGVGVAAGAISGDTARAGEGAAAAASSA